MSALTRLISQATGQAQPGFRPKLPSRFEVGGFSGDGFVTQQEEVAAQPATNRAPKVDAENSAGVVPQGTEPPRDTDRIRDPAKPVPGAAPEDVPASAVPVQQPPPPLHVRRSFADEPDLPDLPVQVPERAAPERPATPATQTNAAPPLPNAEPNARETTAETKQPPQALLPPLPQLPSEGFDVPEAAQPVAPPPPAAEPTAVPEISIHIGRIELRESAQDAPAKPARKHRGPAVTPLSDYLKGGSG